MNRTHMTLAGLLAVQVILLLMVQGPFSGQAAALEARPLLGSLESMAPTRLRIQDGENKAVELVKDGDAWTLADAGGFPVDGAKVRTLLGDLEKLSVRKPVVSSDRYHGALKVAEGDFERRLQVWEDPAGEPAVDFLLGTSSNYRVAHGRVAGDDRVYEVQFSTWDLRTEPGSWVEKKFMDVAPERIVGLKLTNSHGRLELARENGAWRMVSPAGQAVDATKVDSLVRSISTLYLADPVGAVDAAAQGLSEPAAVLEVVSLVNDPAPTEEAASDPAGETDPEGPGGAAGDPAASETPVAAAQAPPETRTIVLRVGGAAPGDEGGEGKRYASRSGFDYAVTLSKFDAEKLLLKQAKDLAPAAAS